MAWQEVLILALFRGRASRDFALDAHHDGDRDGTGHSSFKVHFHIIKYYTYKGSDPTMLTHLSSHTCHFGKKTSISLRNESDRIGSDETSYFMA